MKILTGWAQGKQYILGELKMADVKFTLCDIRFNEISKWFEVRVVGEYKNEELGINITKQQFRLFKYHFKGCRNELQKNEKIEAARLLASEFHSDKEEIESMKVTLFGRIKEQFNYHKRYENQVFIDRNKDMVNRADFSNDKPVQELKASVSELRKKLREEEKKLQALQNEICLEYLQAGKDDAFLEFPSELKTAIIEKLEAKKYFAIDPFFG